jgi:hypothetical protein
VKQGVNEFKEAERKSDQKEPGGLVNMEPNIMNRARNINVMIRIGGEIYNVIAEEQIPVKLMIKKIRSLNKLNLKEFYVLEPNARREKKNN